MADQVTFTKDEFYQAFKGQLEAGDPNAVAFANEAGEKYHGLNRKLTPDEVVALYSQKNPGRVSFSDVTPDQIQKSLTGLGAASGKPAPAAQEKSGDSGGFLQRAGTPLAEGKREGIKKATGAYTLTSPTGVAAVGLGAAMGKGQQTALFVQGFGRGLGDLGVDLTSPLNIGITAASMFGGAAMKGLSKLPKLAKAASLLIKGGHAAFTVEMLNDLASEVPAVKAAIDKGDFQAAGEAAAKAMGEVALISGSFREKAGGKAKAASGPAEPVAGPPSRVITQEAVEVGGKPREVRTRENPKLREEIKKKLGKPEQPKVDQADIEREIGNLQEEQAHWREGTGEYNRIEKQIQSLQAQLPKPSAPPRLTDPAVAAKAYTSQQDAARAAAAAEKAKIQQAEGYQVPGPPKAPQEPIPTTNERRLQRQAEANLRAKTPTVVPGLGQRIAPEEVGEFPAQGPPKQRTVGAPKAESSPQAAIPDGGMLRPGVDRQFIVKRKFFGIPEGQRISIIEDPKTGEQTVSMVDEAGNKKPVKLPLRSAVGTLTGKGWIEPAKPVLPPEPVAQPKPAPAPTPKPAASRPSPAPAPKPSVVAPKPAAPAPPDIPKATDMDALRAQREALLAERSRLAEEAQAKTRAAVEKRAEAAAKKKPVAKPKVVKAEATEDAAALAAARAQLEAGTGPKPAEKLTPPEVATAKPAASPVDAKRLAEVTPGVEAVIKTNITPKSGTGWETVQVQATKDFRPIGDPIDMAAKDFTPEAVAKLAAERGADGVKVSNGKPGSRESMAVKFSNYEPGPPKAPAGESPKSGSPPPPTWETIDPDKRMALAKASLETNEETANPSEEDIKFTADAIGDMAKKKGLSRALLDYGLDQKQILQILFSSGGK